MRNVLRTYVRNNLVASAARTADGNSGTLSPNLPTDLHSGVFIVDCPTVTGTTPTLDLAIEISPDDGTTYYTAFRFAQITAAAVRRLAVKFVAVDAGSEASIPADPSGGALATGCVITEKMRVRWNIGGTSPSFTFAVHFIGRPLAHGGISY